MWSREELFFAGDAFFEAVLSEIEKAQRSIEIETYIFEPGELANRMVDSLILAAGRGVQVRVLVDGIGSPQFSSVFGDRLQKGGVSTRIFHALPWDRWAYRFDSSGWFMRTLHLIRLINQRDHRKLYLIDRKIAFLGSMNVSDEHLVSVRGDRAWKDVSVRVEGRPILWINLAFRTVWESVSRLSSLRSRRRLARQFRTWIKKTAHQKNRAGRSWVEVNVSRQNRRLKSRKLVMRMRQARTRVWLTNPYFVPSRRLLKTLIDCGKRGIDIRLLLPKHSDIIFMPPLARGYYPKLLKAGVKIYEYLPSILHAKTALIDDWGRVGSSNLNHRSWIHDLELNVVLGQKESLAQLEASYEMDLVSSRPMTLIEFNRLPWEQRLLGQLAFMFRYFL